MQWMIAATTRATSPAIALGELAAGTPQSNGAPSVIARKRLGPLDASNDFRGGRPMSVIRALHIVGLSRR